VNNLTPRQTVAELDKYIVGQHDAKKAVAVSLRNRWRRLQLPDKMQEEVTPKNIIMIGATGVGKTEVARRLAKLTNSPFVKVEASKFTEVGYVGRDVESMIRDLTEIAIVLVHNEKKESLSDKVAERTEERLLDLLLPPKPKTEPAQAGYAIEQKSEDDSPTREKFRKMLRDGKLDDREVELTVDEAGPQIEVLSNMGLEEMGINIGDAMKNIFPGRKKAKKVKIKDARAIVEQQEAGKLVDMEEVRSIALKRVQEQGIIFIDEIDKICQSAESRRGGDVSREGVQRDLLPIVEGSTVLTKYGMVKTDHILFIAAGAFSVAKPSDLLPELQGRFPIRVELDNLTQNDFIRILTEPENAITKQYAALLSQDDVFLSFTEDGIEAIAAMAFEMNQTVENIGARRLHTLMEKVLEEVSFDAPECARGEIKIDKAYVYTRLEKIVQDKQMRTYIL
jgi:ATP-dependent HslUV protease ATP-binding subunit HslU